MQPLRALRRRVWQRLEPRVHAAVDQRLDHHLGLVSAREPAEAARPVAGCPAPDGDRRLDELGRQLRSAAAAAADARRLATEASRAIERVLQAELELWQALDAMGAVDHANLLEQSRRHLDAPATARRGRRPGGARPER